MASTSSAQTRRKTSLRITYSHPGAMPPVFVATSLTSPPWQPHEMQYASMENSSELEFYREFYDIEEGDYHYKFRLGYGEWWVLNESAPKVTDNAGNLNNLLTVTPESDEATVERSTSNPAHDHQITEEASRELEGTPGLETTPITDELEIPITTLETTEGQEEPTTVFVDHKHSQQKAVTPRAGAEPDAVSWPDRPNVVTDNDKDRDVEAQAPIGEFDSIRINRDDHSSAGIVGEQAAPRRLDEADKPREVTAKTDQGTLYANGPSGASAPIPVVGETNALAGETPDMQDEPTMVQIQSASQKNPFLETITENADSEVILNDPKTLADQNSGFAAALGYQTPDSGSPRTEHAPLFSHEIFASLPEDATVAGRRQPVRKPASTLREVQLADDFNQPNLELFPTDRADILETIQSTEARLKEDETRADGTLPSPVVTSKQSPELAIERLVSNISLESSMEQPALECIPEFSSDTAQLVQADETVESAASPAAAEQPTEQIGSAAVEKPTNPLTSSSPLTPPLTPKTPQELFLNETENKTNPSVEESISAETSAEASRPTSDTNTAQPEQTTGSLRKRNMPSSSEVRPASPASTGKEEQRNEGILMNIWRGLFGRWLGPVMHWFVGLVGGRGRAA